ncbi:MAG: thioredoxin family protein [Prevotella sp.]
MIKRIYLQLFTLIVVVCYTSNITAENYNLVPTSTDRKAFVQLSSISGKGQILITNYGSTPVQNFEYTLSFEGNILQTQKHILAKPLGNNEGIKVEVNVPPHDFISETEIKLAITKVNDKENSASNSFATLPRITVTKVPHRRIVVEEYTGMWCPYCPRGLALMENLEKTYPNDFIGIAVHTGGTADPLTCWDYASKARDYSSRPTLMMNRNLFLINAKAISEFEEEKAKGAEMDIEVSAKWDVQKENITVTPRVTFRVNKEDGLYGFAYVLTEDGMSNPNWIQLNAYSGRMVDKGLSEELDGFINSPFRLQGFVNNCVAIAAEGVLYPLRGYIKTPIVADETQSHDYMFTNISGKKVIQDKSKLSVCVLLINIKTGQIENAAKCSIDDAPATSIVPLSQKHSTVIEVARYTLDGCRILTPQKGINLVKYSDGRVCKELVK